MALVRKEKEELREEVVQLRRELQNVTPRSDERTKLRIPEPKAYGGARSAKELENFLWDMEQYFQAVRVPDDEKVTITPMYLTDNAKVWWRTRVAEVESAGLPKIKTWEMLKKELKSQFLPTNSSWIARDGLRRLKQSGTMREYVKEFSSLMLNVNALADLNIGDDPAETSHSKADGKKDKAREWKKSGKGQTAEDEGFAKNVRQEIHNGKERSEKQEQAAETNAIVADVNGAPGALYVNNPLGLFH
ncbi:uncharacterized protein [Nicotiana sylvestris]|uniref:uncharacterized protein n=1 Tax=Nicotiana sylvestris TaxID=4096 RepID=UPI00388CC62F